MIEKIPQSRVGIWIPISIAILCLAQAVVGSPLSQYEGEGKRSYRNYKVLRTEPLLNEDAIEKLMEFDGREDISFWKYPSLNESVDIMASPEKFELVEKTVKDMGLNHVKIIDDVEALFEGQNDVEFNEKQAVGTLSWNRYHRYDSIMSYAKNQAARDGMVSYQSIGTSTEGREIGLVTISSGSGNKPAIFLDGGIHAREWISPATVTYIMHQLITNDNYRDLVESYDWYIVPIINVDGYEYTHTRERMWRKTRSRNQGSHCVGTDPNRNWGYQWGGKGTSRDPCSDVYHGTRAFSEPETAAVANAIMARRNRIKMYLTFHSYSQLWLMPWSYTRQRPSDYNELYNLARAGAQGIRQTYGTSYRVGTAPELLYEAAGGSDDWAKGSAGIKYSYTVELRDTGTYGFALPASQIQATGEETMRGVAAAARALSKSLKNPATG